MLLGKLSINMRWTYASENSKYVQKIIGIVVEGFRQNWPNHTNLSEFQNFDESFDKFGQIGPNLSTKFSQN